jgi:hypothetical protein
MHSLREQQREFGKILLQPGKAPDVGPGFEIYAGNVYGNWTKALASAYPVVRKILGESFFEGVAREYSRAHPSVSGDLNEFGARFPGFVAEFPDAQDLPYLPDVARMEWLAHCAYFAADAPPLDQARLAAVPPEDYSSLRLQCAPGCALIASEWPLARIWEVHQEGYRGELNVDLQSGDEQILIHRPCWHVIVNSVAPGDYRFLVEATRGAALGDALQAASDADPQFDVAGALARWVGEGVVTL